MKKRYRRTINLSFLNLFSETHFRLFCFIVDDIHNVQLNLLGGIKEALHRILLNWAFYCDNDSCFA